MKLCKKCLYPDTKPDLEFDEKGRCSACNNAWLKGKINWQDKKNELRRLLNNYRGMKPWDCIIPVSGGKTFVYCISKKNS